MTELEKIIELSRTVRDLEQKIKHNLDSIVILAKICQIQNETAEKMLRTLDSHQNRMDSHFN